MIVENIRQAMIRYREADPFPWTTIEGLVQPDVVEAAEAEFDDVPAEAWKPFVGRATVDHKYQMNDRSAMGPTCRRVIEQLSSDMFLKALQRITGIEGLIADPDLKGAGLHEVRSGGFLRVHVDFNWHKELRARRRLNLLLYLNKVWSSEWGGDLELWDGSSATLRHRIAPSAGTVVLFESSDRSYHGHPRPMTCPPSRARRSIALYYYTPEPSPEGRHSTIYRNWGA